MLHLLASTVPVTPTQSRYARLEKLWTDHVSVVDLQGLYPAEYVPDFMKSLMFYLEDTYHDQSFSQMQPFFKAFIWSELLFQLPVMLWSLKSLYQGMHSHLSTFGPSRAKNWQC